MTGAAPLSLHVVYADSAVIVSRREYASWRAIEADYPGYQTSLGPWSEAEVVAYMAGEHPELAGTVAVSIPAWLAGGADNIHLLP
ncbi:MAG TPA: hypothetical protein DC063_01300 [Arenimonas sp.]|nr:hypothetical protein [Arenimonas sp.]